jgi:hypothetical protein
MPVKDRRFETRCDGYTAAFRSFVRPAFCRSIDPWSACAAPGYRFSMEQVLD